MALLYAYDHPPLYPLVVPLLSQLQGCGRINPRAGTQSPASLAEIAKGNSTGATDSALFEDTSSFGEMDIGENPFP